MEALDVCFLFVKLFVAGFVMICDEIREVAVLYFQKLSSVIALSLSKTHSRSAKVRLQNLISEHTALQLHEFHHKLSHNLQQII